MSGTNRFLAQDIARIKSPITFTTTAGAADAAAAMPIVRANIDLILAMLSLEEADANVARFFLDEMSPSARNVMYKIITDLRTASPNIS